jgi:nucleoside-diphosphate-sugar epimerase
VRPFSGYGEDQDLTYPVPSIALRVARRDDPIEVWGTGEQGRDFIYIDDCIDAMLVILGKVNDGRGINIGTGKLTSFNELIKTLCTLEDHKGEIRRLTDKPVGVQSRYADTTVLNGEIGWFPLTSLEDGMRKVLAQAHHRLQDKNAL